MPPSVTNVQNMRKANAEIQRHLLDSMRSSVFKIHTDPTYSSESFVGTAWKIHPRLLVTCWHVLGQVQQSGIYSEAVPSAAPQQQAYFVINPRCQSIAEVVPMNWPFDICFLMMPVDIPCPHLLLSDEYANAQDFCAVYGYGQGGVVRSETGKVSGYVQSANESLISAPSDHSMSGSPVMNYWGAVIGMVTGFVGERGFKTRMLSLAPLRQALSQCLSA